VGEEASVSDLAFEGARTLTPGLGTLTVRVERIVNRAAQGVSGTLAVRLRVQPESCRGGPSDGRIVGGSKLQAIPAGAALRDFSVIIPTENVPSGYYVPALTLEEQHPGASNRWGVVQTVPIGERMFIGRRVTLRGISLKREADPALQISIGELRNQTAETTGTISLVVFATDEPYAGGSIKGQRLVAHPAGSLAASEVQRGITLTAVTSTPPAHVAILVLEDAAGGEQKWHLRDYATAVVPAEISARQETPHIEEADLIGQAGAKASLQQVIALARVNEERRRRGLPVGHVTLHSAFTGSPGTGKTTFARFYAQQIRSLGLLARGHLVEVSRADLVASYSGQTAPQTAKVIESAIGGVLFIDEAYALKQGKDDSFGQECIDEIVKQMEDHRDDLVVIFAGYSREMHEFLRQNSGLLSRVPQVIEFADFDDQELGAILDAFCRQRAVTMPASVREYAVEQVAARRRGRSFANARDVRNLFERGLAGQSVRLGRQDLQALSADQLSELWYSDFGGGVDDAREPPERGSPGVTALAALDGLVGLPAVKREIRELASLIRLERRRNPGRTLPAMRLHRLYAGGPGTGKKTVAALYAALLHEVGLLARGQVRQVSAADLIAGYVGQTGSKTRERVEEALGGVLYVQNAPALWRRQGQYEVEAIDALMEAAAACRDRLVIVLAGGRDDILKLPATDPRVGALFDKPTTFGDPGSDDLLEIGRRFAAERGFRIDDAAAEVLRQLIDVSRMSPGFTNTHAVRALLERAYGAHALRVEQLGDPLQLDDQVLRVLHAEDLAAQIG
jgi:SpoVK/Ycf46/Vps4 family AAA+-type ATPase